MTGEDGALTLDFEDAIIAGACITRGGEIVHEGARKARRGGIADMDLLTELAILVLAAFVGFEVISKVPNTLHTPLMSATNAIHGIVLLGAILVIGPADGFLNELLLVIAIAFGTINVVGGFLVTDRMLGMFKGRKPDPQKPEADDEPGSTGVNLLYIVGFALFIVGPAHGARPAHGGARQPDRRGRHGDRAGRDAARRRGSATGC